MKKIICYMPFFENRAEAFSQLEQTLKSVAGLAVNIFSVRLFYCQPENRDKIARAGSLVEAMGIQFESRLVSVPRPVFLPIATYRFMQADGLADDCCFYTEADHIFHIEPGFIHHVFEEVQKGNVVMPHRLGKHWRHKNLEPRPWGEYYLGNSFSPNVHPYSDAFDAMTGYYNAYAGSYFAQRSVIQKHLLSFPLTTNLIWRGMVEYVRRLSGRRLFASQAPYGLMLEAPSLVFEANGQRVLKPHHVKDFHVIHLSDDYGIGG